MLSRRAELSTDDQEIIRFRLEIGSIWDLRLFDAGQAITAYQKVLDLEPSNMVALRALEQLYEKTEQTEKYLDVLEAQLDATPSDAERVSLYERMAAAWEERFGKLDRAAEAYEKIVAIDQRNYGAYRVLARLYQQAGKYEALVETYRNHIGRRPTSTTRIELYVAMGQVYESQLNEVDRAIEAYNDVLAFDPDERARSTRSAACTRRSASGTARSTCSTGSSSSPTIRASRSSCTGASAASSTTSSATPTAPRPTCSAVSRSMPAHVPSMEALTKQYSDRGDWLKAAQMMVRAESYTPVASTRSACCSRPRTSTCTSCVRTTRRSSCTPR